MEKDETDSYAWYVMGTALSLENRIDEAIDAHCTGLSYAPFYILNYFGPSKKTQRKRRMEAGTGRLYSLHSAGTTELDILVLQGYYREYSRHGGRKYRRLQGMPEYHTPLLNYKSFDFPTEGFQLRDTYSVP